MSSCYRCRPEGLAAAFSLHLSKGLVTKHSHASKWQRETGLARENSCPCWNLWERVLKDKMKDKILAVAAFRAAGEEAGLGDDRCHPDCRALQLEIRHVHCWAAASVKVAWRAQRGSGKAWLMLKKAIMCWEGWWQFLTQICNMTSLCHGLVF